MVALEDLFSLFVFVWAVVHISYVAREDIRAVRKAALGAVLELYKKEEFQFLGSVARLLNDSTIVDAAAPRTKDTATLDGALRDAYPSTDPDRAMMQDMILDLMVAINRLAIAHDVESNEKAAAKVCEMVPSAVMEDRFYWEHFCHFANTYGPHMEFVRTMESVSDDACVEWVHPRTADEDK